MHGVIRSIAFVLFLFCFIWGCGGSPNVLKEIPTTVNTVKAAKGHIKKVALALIQVPDTAIGKAVGEHYLKALDGSIRSDNGWLQLSLPGDEAFPSFLAPFPVPPTQQVDAASLIAQGRRDGYQGLIAASIADIRPVAKKTGIFWLRKTRHFIHYTVTVDLYDPFTAAKIVSEVMEDSIKISEQEYETLQSGEASSFEDLNEAIEDVAQDHGEHIAQALKKHQWKSMVLDAFDELDDRVLLPAAAKSGLRNGDRLAVFEGRRMLENKHGQKFIATGVKVGEIEITAVTDNGIEAKALNSGDIKAGDIVIPLN